MGREMKQTNGKYAAHETVSEDEKAITPEFATKEELIEHLVNKGTEWDKPLDRKIAEEFVLRTPFVPSGALVNGKFLKGFDVLLTKISA